MSAAVLAAAMAGGVAALALGELARALARPRTRCVRLLVAIGRRLGRPTPSHDLAARLAAAGAPAGLAPADVVAAQLGGGALAALAGLAVLPVALVPVPVALALAAPRVALARRAGHRRRAIGSEVADVLDLLRVAVAAGLSPERALGEVGRRHRGTLGPELARTAAVIALGVPRERALADLAAGAPDPAVAALCRALVAAAALGASLEAPLAALAADARAARARRLAEHGARAAPKVQLVVSLLQVPAVLLLVAAALLTTFAP